MQETFIRAWRSRDRYEPGRASLRTWLFAIVRNVVIDMARARAVRPQVVNEPTDLVADDADPIEDRMRRAQVEEALRRIGPDHRRVIVEIHLRGRPTAEVAAELGVPDGTVRSRLFYGLKALKGTLVEVGWTDVS